MALLLWNLAATAASDSDIAAAQYAEVNANLIDSHVIPRYENLARSAAQFERIVRIFCGPESDLELTDLRHAFHLMMDAWFGIAHLHFGPIKFYMRQYRFYFWPQARGKVLDATAAFIAAGDARPLAESNVAVQGFLAAEALLFHERFLGSSAMQKRPLCSMLKAVSKNLAAMAAGTLAEWRAGDAAYAHYMQHPSSDNPFYESHSAATLDLFQSLYNALQFSFDIRLRPVVGDSIAAARPVLAESRYSARSTRNLIAVLGALQDLYGGDDRAGLGSLTAITDPELHALMQKAFRATLATARALEAPIEDAAVDAQKRPQTEKLGRQVQALKQIARERLSKALGLTVGFNALDGD